MISSILRISLYNGGEKRRALFFITCFKSKNKSPLLFRDAPRAVGKRRKKKQAPAIPRASNWLGRLDSNQRMTESKSVALPLGYAPTTRIATDNLFSPLSSRDLFVFQVFDCFFIKIVYCVPCDAPVAQLDRVSASEAEGRGFESRRAHHFDFSLSGDSPFPKRRRLRFARGKRRTKKPERPVWREFSVFSPENGYLT